MMQTFWQDIRYGMRMLFKNPGFTLTAILTLALGIGANTAIFSVVNAVLLRPLPYNQPEGLVAVWESDTRKADVRGAYSYPNFFDLRSQNTSFEQVAMYYQSSTTLTGIETPVNLQSVVTSADLFSVLRARPQLGRAFTADEEKPGSNLAVVISHRLWQKQFGGDPNILERGIKLNDRLYTIIGVMPAGFQFPIEVEAADLWVTFVLDATRTGEDPPQTENRGSHFMHVIARLKSGVSFEQAQAEADVIGKQLEAQHPKENTYRSIKLYPFHDDLVNDYSEALWIILGAVGCVLLIACANVANLLLARATVRHKEIAIRAALGASRWQIIRQLLTESSLLAFAGGALGLLLAGWGTEVLVTLIPEDLPRLAEINMDWWVLGFTFAVSLLTGIVFGLAPALQATKIELTEALKESGRAGVSRHRSRLRNTLVITEVAVAVVLLVGAGLLLQSFHKLQNVNLGFDTKNVLTAEVELPEARYPKPHQAAEFYKQLLERVEGLPGVVKASAIMPQPLSGNMFRTAVDFEGRDYSPGDKPRTMFRTIALDYIDTMKIGLVNGRDFTDRDTEKSQMVALVNEAFVKAYFPDETPIGKLVKPGISMSGEAPWREIVGVVKNVKHRTPKHDYDPELYVPHTQAAFSSMGLVIRTAGDPKAVARALQAEVSGLDKDLPVYRVKTLEQYLGTAIAQPRFNALLLGMFGLLALILTAIGLYGVMAYSVAQRTREIGIRMALGAKGRDVLHLVLRQGLTLTVMGLVIGIGSSYFLTQLLTKLLYGIGRTDPVTFVITSLILTGVALAACFVPARRATKVDPMVALHYE
jgi:putative ABC transport system permease protein